MGQAYELQKKTAVNGIETHPLPEKTKKVLANFSGRKLMATVFWDREHILLLVDCLDRSSTLTSERYCETFKKLQWLE